MSKLKFSPSDFFTKTFFQRTLGNENCITCKEAARFAQDLFDKWLVCQQKVYGHPDYRILAQSWHSIHSNSRRMEPYEDTHTARLVCVEEMKTKEKCEHIPMILSSSVSQSIISFVCSKCNKSLIAKFEETNDPNK